jgi:L-fuconate dehydratase
LNLSSIFFTIIIPLPTGYSDGKVAQLTKEAVRAGFTHFKMKVGADQDDDLRRGKLIRSIIDDPQYLRSRPRDLLVGAGEELALRGKNAGPTGAVLMIDANQVWDVEQAIEYVKGLQEIKPWSVHCFTTLYPTGGSGGGG